RVGLYLGRDLRVRPAAPARVVHFARVRLPVFMRDRPRRTVRGRSWGRRSPGQETTMPYYRVVGEVPRKRHVQFRRPDGGLYAEELMGEEGFSSDSSLLYHVHAPTAIIKSEG